MSQLALAVEAEVSARHLSFIETGRAQPSREMLLPLARVLEVPPRARNELLLAAGFAPCDRERALDAPEMAQVRRALDFMLRQQEPYPGLVVDGRWNILLANEGAQRLIGLFLDPAEAAALGPPNAMRLFCHPRGMRPYIVNWEPTAAALVQWLHRDLLRNAGDGETARLLGGDPGLPRRAAPLANRGPDASTAPFLAVELAKGDLRLSFFSTLAGLGVPYDITAPRAARGVLLPRRRRQRGFTPRSRAGGRRGEAARRLEPAPDLVGQLDAEGELGALLLHADVVAVHRRGEAALGAQAELLEGNVLRGLVEAAA